MKSMKLVLIGLAMSFMIPSPVFASLEFLKTAQFFCIHTTDNEGQWFLFARNKKENDKLIVRTGLSGENCKEVYSRWEDSNIIYTCDSLTLEKDGPLDTDIATLNCRVHMPGEPWAEYVTTMIIKGTDHEGRLKDPYLTIMHEDSWLDYDKTEILDKKE